MTGEPRVRVDGTVSAEAEITVRRLSILLVAGAPHPSALTTAVATVEAHVDATIQQLLDRSGAAHSQLGAFLIDRTTASFRQTWAARQELLRDGFGVVVEPQALVQQLSLIVDARNALAHGDGSMTAMQTTSWSKAHELRRNFERKIQVSVEGRSLTITTRSVAIAVKMLIDYVIGLDLAVKEIR